MAFTGIRIILQQCGTTLFSSYNVNA